MNAKLALFAAILIAGCSSGPVYYVPADAAPVGKQCDPSGWWCQPVYAPASTSVPKEEKPSVSVMPMTTSTIILFQSYANPYNPIYLPPASPCCRNIGNKWWRY